VRSTATAKPLDFGVKDEWAIPIGIAHFLNVGNTKAEIGENEMTREELEKYIDDNYSVEPDYPWIKYPDYEVFRHTSNKKWFALIMEVPKNKLGLPTNDILSIVNFKCDPILIGSFLDKEGYFPAYHMNKTSWITVALDGSVSDDEIKMLLDMSFEATAPKIRRKKEEF